MRANEDLALRVLGLLSCAGVSCAGRAKEKEASKEYILTYVSMQVWACMFVFNE